MRDVFIRFRRGLLGCGMLGCGFCFLGKLILVGCGIGLVRVRKVVRVLVRLGIYRRFHILYRVHNELQR